VRADDLGHAPSIQRARLGAYRPIWEEFKTKQHHRKNYRVYSIYFSVIFNYAPNIFYKNYKKIPLRLNLRCTPLTKRPYKTCLSLPPHSTTLTCSPLLIFLLLPLHVRRTHAKEKRRDFYISGLKLSRGEVGGEEEDLQIKTR
jgi:hypothetical protein